MLKGLPRRRRAGSGGGDAQVSSSLWLTVQIALGTDAGVIEHGTNAREFVLMVEWGGMTPMESLMAGTMGGAKLRLGLRRESFADIVAVPGDPLQDIHATQREFRYEVE